MYPSHLKKQTAKGFTIAEVLISVAILAIGLIAMGSLIARTSSDTTRSKYMSLASTLASEKLEDLNRWPANDPHVVVPAGTTAGSLTSDVKQSVTVGATTENINYFDDILLSSTAGAISETVSGLDASGNTVYTTTSLTPNGTTPVPVTTSSAPSAPFTFKRRWIIEKDQPVTGVSRITVRVILQNQSIKPPVAFQMSTVRPTE